MIYHVMNRSVARIRLFRGPSDYAAFLRTLAQAMARVPTVDLLAYCVMPNHWHLVLRPHGDRDLSAFMQWLTLAHAQRWRTSHRTVGYGPLYQGRFKAFAIEEDRHLLTVLRYVERNPLRAKLVRRAEEWEWSSLYARQNADGPDESDDHPRLSPWPVRVPRNWTELVNEPQTAAEEAAIAVSIARSRPFGRPDWQTTTADRLGLRCCFRPRGRPPQAEPPDAPPATPAPPQRDRRP